MQIRSTEINLEQARVIESTLASLAQAEQQVDLAGQAKRNYQVALDAEKDKYRTGRSDLLSVLTVSQYAVGASATYVRSLADLDSQRVQLQRVLISGPFTKIPTCRLGGAERTGGIFGFLKGIFKKRSSRYATIDEMCRPDPNAVAAATGH